MGNSDSIRPLGYSEQLELLQGRGMIVRDRAEVLGFLQHVNYFRLSEYWRIFADANKQFQKGTSFDVVLATYKFDRNLRMLVFDAIEMIEVSLRANFAYCLAVKHGPRAHLQMKLSVDKNLWGSNHQKLVRQIGQSSQNRIRPESPIWEISEAISFGLLSMMYKNLNSASRKEIARIYDLEGKVFGVWLHHLTQLRNFCSHHCRLWNRQFRAVAGRPQKIKAFAERWNPESRRIYNSLLIIGYLLSKLPLQSEWGLRISALLDELPAEYLKDHMGFPDDWNHENLSSW